MINFSPSDNNYATLTTRNGTRAYCIIVSALQAVTATEEKLNSKGISTLLKPFLWNYLTYLPSFSDIIIFLW